MKNVIFAADNAKSDVSIDAINQKYYFLTSLYS